MSARVFTVLAFLAGAGARPAAAQDDERWIERCRPGDRYTGVRLSVDLARADVDVALVGLSRVVGFDLVVADDVRGQVTLRLTEVPWDQVVCAVVKNEGLRAHVQASSGLWLISRHGQVP